MKPFSWPTAWGGWRPQHAQVIKVLIIVAAVCGVLATAAGLGLPPTLVAWIAAIGTIAGTVKDILNQQAVTQALNTLPPQKQEAKSSMRESGPIIVPDPPPGGEL